MSIFPCPWRRLSASKPAKRSVIGKRLRVCFSSHCQLLAARQRGQCRSPQERGAQCRCRQCGQAKRLAPSADVPQAARRQSTRNLCLPSLSSGSKAGRKVRRILPNVKRSGAVSVLLSTRGQSEFMSVRLGGELARVTGSRLAPEVAGVDEI